MKRLTEKNKLYRDYRIVFLLITKYSTKTPENIPEAKAVNEELYQACKLEADNEYKKVMNTRAVLFKKAAPEGFLDVNKPDLIYDRGELAIQVVGLGR